MAFLDNSEFGGSKAMTLLDVKEQETATDKIIGTFPTCFWLIPPLFLEAGLID